MTDEGEMMEMDEAEAAAYDDGIDLGRLRGNVGNLVHDIPDDPDLSELDTVAIWSDRFGVVFGAAGLTPV